MKELPSPDSDALRSLRLSSSARDIYGVLFENRNADPLTMQEIRERLGGISHEQLQRRRRELNPFFVIEKTTKGKDTAYRLVTWKERSPNKQTGISERDRAAVLQVSRCAMCGKTPIEDGIKLQVDHKIPRVWGGSDERENLQPLCEECNRGKKDLFATYDEFIDRIRLAINFEEPHKRIGELLQAFQGDWVPSYLIGIVASAKQYQEDWQKRLRELRTLGWKIESRREKTEARTLAYYRVTHSEPWPKGSVRAEITRRERKV